MRRISSPIECDVAFIAEACAKSIQNKELSARLRTEIGNLTALETDYSQRAASRTLYQYAESENAGQVTKSEMSDLYTNTFVRQTGPTRYIYNYIMSLPENSLCPLCNQRDVSTLDHHLSKAYHPAFSLTPVNLVPACKNCNTDTLARRPTQAIEQTLHPYFDDPDNEQWLVAAVLETDPPTFVFKVDPNLDVREERYAIIKSHFETFKLAKLYTSVAAGMALSMRGELRRNFASGGVDAVIRELRYKAEDNRSLVRNSWQSAMLDGMANSAWFCNGGFELLKPRSPDKARHWQDKYTEQERDIERERLKHDFAAQKKGKKKSSR